MKPIPVLLTLVSLGLAACGGSSQTGTTAVSPAAQTAVQNYYSAGTDISAVIRQYRIDSAAMPDVSSCQAIEAAYQAKIAPLIERLGTTSAALDPYMSGAMGPTGADMACVAAAMKAELARHAAVACTLPDIAADRAEAAQHAATMTGLVDHQCIRYQQVGDACGMMPPTSNSTWTCKQNPDGTFTFGGQPWTPPQPLPAPTWNNASPMPWPMPCGGMMCSCDGNWGTTGGAPGGTPSGSPPSGSPGTPAA